MSLTITFGCVFFFKKKMKFFVFRIEISYKNVCVITYICVYVMYVRMFAYTPAIYTVNSDYFFHCCIIMVLLMLPFIQKPIFTLLPCKNFLHTKSHTKSIKHIMLYAIKLIGQQNSNV